MIPMLGADAYVYMLAGLAALGALVVALAPFLGLEPAPEPGIVKAEGQGDTDQRPFWRRKRDVLKQTRNALGKLRSTSDGQLPVETPAKQKKSRSEPSPEDVSSTPPADAGSAPAVLQPEGGTGPVPQDEKTPDADTESEQDESRSPESNLLDAFSEDLADAGDSDTYEDDEEDKKDEDSGSLFGDDSDSKPGDTDSLFDLFSTEIVEDNEAGKLAASLDDVDVRDLLSEAQQVLGEIRDVRQARRHHTPPH